MTFLYIPDKNNTNLAKTPLFTHFFAKKTALRLDGVDSRSATNAKS